MNWLNIEVQKLRNAPFIGSTPEELGIWLRTTTYCAECENGGRIVGGNLWNDRQLMAACGLTREELSRAGTLVTVDGDDIVVSAYPVAKEAEVIARRQQAKINGRNGGRRQKTGAETSAGGDTGTDTGTNVGSNVGGHVGKRKEKEKEKEKENRKEKKNTSSADAPPDGGKEKRFPLPDSVAARVKALYRRKPATQWGHTEITAARKLSGIGEASLLEDLDIFERARAAGWQYHRKDPATLFNNWPGERDRADDYLREQKRNGHGKANGNPQPQLDLINPWENDQ